MCAKLGVILNTLKNAILYNLIYFISSSGAVKTNFTSTSGLSDETLRDRYESIRKATPLGLMGEPQDIANSVAFLASKEASFITGTSMVVDAGLLYSSFI